MTETDRRMLQEAKTEHIPSAPLFEFIKTIEKYMSEGWEQNYRTHITLIRHRWETDAEYNERKAGERKEKERTEKAKVTAKERRRNQYEKLKKEFGND